MRSCFHLHKVDALGFFRVGEGRVGVEIMKELFRYMHAKILLYLFAWKKTG